MPRDDSHDDDADELGVDPDALARFLDRRDEEKRKERDRKRTPKDLAELWERLPGAILDEAEARAAKRKREAAEDDEEPSRGSGGGGFNLFGRRPA